MSHQLHKSLIRILTADGIPVGVGFLAASNLILTCAHVIEQAIGQEENAHFDFSLLTPRETLSGRVVRHASTIELSLFYTPHSDLWHLGLQGQ